MIKMDELDRKILNLLREDGRMSFVDIAKKLGVPRPTIYLRVKNMKEGGVIKKFSVVLEGEETKGAFLKLKTFLISKMSERVIWRAIDEMCDVPGVLLISKINKNTLFVVWKGNSFDPKEVKNVISIENIEIVHCEE